MNKKQSDEPEDRVLVQENKGNDGDNNVTDGRQGPDSRYKATKKSHSADRLTGKVK